MSVYLFHVYVFTCSMCVCLPVPCVCVYQLRVCLPVMCVYIYLFHVFTFVCSMCLPVPCVLMLQALMGTYIDKKCPFTGNVSIRGRILSGVVLRMKMQRTIVIRREYLHYVKKYSRFEKRHKNMSVHLSPAFKYVQCPVCTALFWGDRPALVFQLFFICPRALFCIMLDSSVFHCKIPQLFFWGGWGGGGGGYCLPLFFHLTCFIFTSSFYLPFLWV